MIRITTEKGKPIYLAELKDRFGVYLDNDALIDLAKGPAIRRQRFVDALQARGTLLFSLTNAAEAAGPQGASALAVRAFLDSVGPYWLPLELDPWTVVQREGAGLVDRAPISEGFMKAFFKQRVSDLSSEGRDDIRRDATEMDQTLRDRLKQLRLKYDNDPEFLERLLPQVSFSERSRATFVTFHLLRMLGLEAKAFQFKPHDALDFCHAVLATAYGNLATLDKQWKRRIENLPTPNRLAKVYYSRELDELVDSLEFLVARK